MKTMVLGKSGVEVPVIAVGCMRMADKTVDEAKALIDTAMSAGLNFFDHADLYGGGKSEEIFSQAIGMNDDVREKIFLQSKCGICPGKTMFAVDTLAICLFLPGKQCPRRTNGTSSQMYRARLF